MIHRRSFLGFIACSPAIVRASSLMHVRPVIENDLREFFYLSTINVWVVGDRTMFMEFDA